MQVQSDSIYAHTRKKKRLSTGTKALVGILVFALIAGVSYLAASSSPGPSNSGQSQYPNNVAGTFYSNPTVTSDGTKATIPYSFADEKKLEFLDLKLQNPTSEIVYKGRTIPLGAYKQGGYLPLVVVVTPLQKVVSGIRVCEPCGSFSFHVVEAKYLQCDLCGTRWDIETFAGVSGGCPNFPPPKVDSSAATDIEVDLSSVGLTLAA